ncbi:zinc metalloprotease HtpX [Schaalia sp. 19OD2882]|uniref:zinc metalloprotease HtpX n=1 Tax=Schaalia sp. 19OD2882 TaxID=2794089 RepID=UPI001C1EAB27|nr:zinc metalloprotease HtpX [Schaalia sp. 19OD2882]QWW19895.1 zinc metalloprotease HtpX [Schaalia sp. 19OD2882]
MRDQHFNGLKTTVLLGGMWALLMLVGAMVAGGTGNSLWLWGFTLFGLATTAWSYWNSASLALRSMNAVEATEAEYPQLHRIVRELAQRAGQPEPTIWIAPTTTPNAFATGRSPKHAAVCCTQGIMQILEERELRAVLGHELMHVYNRDILTSSVAAAMAGVISSVAQAVFFLGGGNRREGGIGAAIGMMLAALAAPFAAMLIQFAISRTREFDADQDGAELTQDPLALASALRKLETVTDHMPMQPTPANQNVAAMMIANPFRGGVMRSLFATHPPMAERIARLEKMAGY